MRDEWQTIETAPKDGTPIRVYGPCPTHGKYEGPAVWKGRKWQKLHRAGFFNMEAYPTHWMPLPKPPVQP